MVAGAVMDAVLICAVRGAVPVVIVVVLAATALETAVDWTARTVAWGVLEDMAQISKWSIVPLKDQSRLCPRQLIKCMHMLHNMA